MNKKILFIIMLILSVVVLSLRIYKKESINNDNIIFYELKTHDHPCGDNQYYIDSKKELKEFYRIYSDVLNIDNNYLKNNSIFIKTMKMSSGSIDIKLKSVNFDNNKVNFVVEKNVPEIGTNDMAYWYLVAIIPNNKLVSISTIEWVRPSSISRENDR